MASTFQTVGQILVPGALLGSLVLHDYPSLTAFFVWSDERHGFCPGLDFLGLALLGYSRRSRTCNFSRSQVLLRGGGWRWSRFLLAIERTFLGAPEIFTSGQDEVADYPDVDEAALCGR
jgi:hypothetical protein